MDDAARLAMLPVSAIALALGICVAGSQSVRTAGRVSTLVDELKRRGVYADMLAAVDPQLAKSITMLDTADRGQRWAQTGRR
jgi:phosphate/sulfate permease